MLHWTSKQPLSTSLDRDPSTHPCSNSLVHITTGESHAYVSFCTQFPTYFMVTFKLMFACEFYTFTFGVCCCYYNICCYIWHHALMSLMQHVTPHATCICTSQLRLQNAEIEFTNTSNSKKKQAKLLSHKTNWFRSVLHGCTQTRGEPHQSKAPESGRKNFSMGEKTQMKTGMIMIQNMQQIQLLFGLLYPL